MNWELPQGRNISATLFFVIPFHPLFTNQEFTLE
jgi:hypothetical protein